MNHRPFRRLFTGSLISQLGFWFSHISFQDLMSDLTEDELWVSALFVVTFVPVLVLGPFGGVLVDRVDRLKVLTGCYLSLVVVATIQLLLVASDSVTPVRLLVTSSLLGTTLAFMGPAGQAVTANVVPPTDLSSAISLQAMSSNLNRTVGPALAAPFIARDWFEATWGAYACGALIATGLLFGVRLRPFEPSPPGVPYLRQIALGVGHARERRQAFDALLLIAAVTVLVVSATALMPSFTEESLNRPKGDFAYLGSVIGFGALLGAAYAGSVGDKVSFRRGAILAWPYCFLATAVALVSNFWVAIVIMFLMGFFYLASFTTLQVLIQQVVDEDMRGRVMSLFQISWGGMVPIGALGWACSRENLASTWERPRRC